MYGNVRALSRYGGALRKAEMSPPPASSTTWRRSRAVRCLALHSSLTRSASPSASEERAKACSVRSASTSAVIRGAEVEVLVGEGVGQLVDHRRLGRRAQVVVGVAADEELLGLVVVVPERAGRQHLVEGLDVVEVLREEAHQLEERLGGVGLVLVLGEVLERELADAGGQVLGRQDADGQVGLPRQAPDLRHLGLELVDGAQPGPATGSGRPPSSSGPSRWWWVVGTLDVVAGGFDCLSPRPQPVVATASGGEHGEDRQPAGGTGFDDGWHVPPGLVWPDRDGAS